MARPPRIKGFDYRGCYQVFLTICTHDRAPAFVEGSLVQQVLSQFLSTAVEYDVEVTAYCVMPDHGHVLATGLSDKADIAGFMKIAKQRTGFEFRQTTGQYLWQEGYYDHVLRAEESAPSVIRYIINNPLRAGLVASPSDYPFWGSQKYSREELLDYVQGVDEWVPEWKRRRV